MEYIILIILIIASVSDIKHRTVPIYCQIALLLTLPFVYVNENVWGVLLAVPFLVASGVSGGMGGGDWKMVGLLGLCLGFYKTFAATLIGCIIFIVVGYMVEWHKGKEKSLFPFIPALTIGYITTLILEVYINWIK